MPDHCNGPQSGKPRRDSSDGSRKVGLHSLLRLLQTPSGGRNQPCPCGSGRKFKKCCGP
ncbi:MAG: SEC-C metal-binding domain-containing protein [Verrucomicrobiota bacterium]